MQELVGRILILITLDDLDEDDLVRILTEPDMYELPDIENITECRITKNTITTKIPVWQTVQDSELYLNDV